MTSCGLTWRLFRKSWRRTIRGPATSWHVLLPGPTPICSASWISSSRRLKWLAPRASSSAHEEYMPGSVSD
jgi:hypothetical protein